MIRLSEDEILSLHSKLVQRYGGSDGIRDDCSLDAALSTPFQTFGGMDLYPTVIDKAVRLAYGLITDHPFIDGNKRIGAMAMLITLRLNHIALSYAQSELTFCHFDASDCQGQAIPVLPRGNFSNLIRDTASGA